MSMHYTDSKCQQNSSVAKTPFSIEDILFQNGNVPKSVHKSGENEYGGGAQVNGSAAQVNHTSDKSNRNGNTISSSEEYRKVLHNERSVFVLVPDARGDFRLIFALLALGR